MDLIVTCARHLEEDARGEMMRMLGEMGDQDASVSVTDMSGILTVRTRLDPVGVSRWIRGRLEDEPWSVRYCLRVIPVQSTVKSDISDIRDAARDLAGRMPPDDTYRVTIEKRHSDVSATEIITGIAGMFGNRVSLDSPDRIVLVEILGGVAGVSILERHDILSVEKAKRGVS